jgi:carbon-monoxide dehydrogenase medium subunit
MYPSAFEYHKPRSVGEALELLARHRGDARCLAGGQSLIPSMKLRLSQPGHLVDLSGLQELRGIEVVGDELAIGAMTTHRQVESSPLVMGALPSLCGVAGGIADPQVRNRGTIGGSLANADPAADYPASLLALEGVLDVIGPDSKRQIRADDWPLGLMATALREGELLVRVRFPVLRGRTAAAYVKVPHPASRFATVGIAAKVERDAQGRCTACRIAITGVGEVVQRARGAEAVMIGSDCSEAAIRSAATRLAAEVAVIQDDLLSEPAKRQLCLMTGRKVLKQATTSAAA